MYFLEVVAQKITLASKPSIEETKKQIFKNRHVTLWHVDSYSQSTDAPRAAVLFAAWDAAVVVTVRRHGLAGRVLRGVKQANWSRLRQQTCIYWTVFKALGVYTYVYHMMRI